MKFIKTVVVFLLFIFLNKIQAQQLPRAESFYIQDSLGNLYSQNLYDSLIKVKTIYLQPIKSQTEIIGYVIKALPQNIIPFTVPKKHYNIQEVYSENHSLSVGQKIKSFDFVDLDGNHFHSDSLKGKVIVLNFWFKNCGPCKAEIPYLNGLVNYYKNNNNIVFIAGSLDDSIACGIFLQRMNYLYHIVPSVRDWTQKYDIYSFPTHIIIDTKGVIKMYCEGYAPGIENYIYEAIQQSLKP